MIDGGRPESALLAFTCRSGFPPWTPLSGLKLGGPCHGRRRQAERATRRGTSRVAYPSREESRADANFAGTAEPSQRVWETGRGEKTHANSHDLYIPPSPSPSLLPALPRGGQSWQRPPCRTAKACAHALAGRATSPLPCCACPFRLLMLSDPLPAPPRGGIYFPFVQQSLSPMLARGHRKRGEKVTNHEGPPGRRAAIKPFLSRGEFPWGSRLPWAACEPAALGACRMCVLASPFKPHPDPRGLPPLSCSWQPSTCNLAQRRPLACKPSLDHGER